MTAVPTVLLLDNGSLEPAATLGLRRLAKTLATQLGIRVHPVSLLHSHKVPADQLEGQPAEIFTQAVQRLAEEGATNFLILPLFFGPSGGITEYLPKQITALQVREPGLGFRVAPCLVDSLNPDDEGILSLLEDNIRQTLAGVKEPAKVILVDHGSPKKEVTAVRDLLALQLGKRLKNEVQWVRPASMERRPEPEFDFNKPLLADALRAPGMSEGPLIISLLFLLPGRHAGPAGDIARICAEAKQQMPALQITTTPLVGSHPSLISLLEKRYKQGLTNPSLTTAQT